MNSRLALGLVVALAAASACTSTRRGVAAPVTTPRGGPVLRWLGSGPRAAMFEAELAEGASLALPNDGCQEVLVFVRAGMIETPEGEQPLGPGDAIRLGSGAPGRTTLVARVASSLFVVLARDDAHAFRAGTTLDDFAAPAGCTADEAAGAAARSDESTRGPFLRNEGALRVFVHLDAPHQGVRHAGLGQLDADADVAVPPHVHDTSDEVLYFESGDGTMLFGDASFPIEAGRFVYIPHGVPHAFTPSGEAPMRAFQSYAPSGPEQRFRAPAPVAVEVPPATPALPAAPEAAPIPCTSERDCWVDPNPAWHPVARPRELRGRTYRPCRDGEHQPVCIEGVCAIRGVSC